MSRSVLSSTSSVQELFFHPLTIDDRRAIQGVTLNAGLRNCNFTFTNLFGWQPFFKTQVCILNDTVILQLQLGDKPAYIINSHTPPSKETILLLMEREKGKPLLLLAMDDEHATTVQQYFPEQTTVTPLRNNYDYIYLRKDLEHLQGKGLKTKRNHVNRFIAEHPDFEYRTLDKSLLPQCLELEHQWRDQIPHDNPEYGDTIETEQKVIERVFDNWDRLDAIGGAVFIDGLMVAFTYGAPVTNDTFDICVEKADRNINGAYNIINQQFVQHLPKQYTYINREEDMGLQGLRKAKLSYNPHTLLGFNRLTIEPAKYTIQRMTPDDADETIEWITTQYNFDREEVKNWVKNLHFNWSMSVKATDSNNKTIGLLNMSDYRIEEETGKISIDCPELLDKLNSMHYIAVFSFIVAEKYRHTKLNYDMLMSIWDDLQEYDFIFIPVMHSLKTHNYWQRWGAREFYRDSMSVYYMLPLSDKAKSVMF